MVTTPARPCSRCHAEPATPGQRWGRRCRNAYKRERAALQREALRICKRAGLTVTVATEGGYASTAPKIVTVEQRDDGTK